MGTRTVAASTARRSTESAADSVPENKGTPVKGEAAGDTAKSDGQNQQQHRTFAAMLRNSKFVQMGDPVGKVRLRQGLRKHVQHSTGWAIRFCTIFS